MTIQDGWHETAIRVRYKDTDRLGVVYYGNYLTFFEIGRAEFMRDLREAMGDPSFFAMLQEYQRRYAYRLASSKDFFELVQEFTTADLVPLEDEYFRQRRLP